MFAAAIIMVNAANISGKVTPDVDFRVAFIMVPPAQQNIRTDFPGPPQARYGYPIMVQSPATLAHCTSGFQLNS
jgi:hypothetical protein